jgi:histidinol dehydrogenase
VDDFVKKTQFSYFSREALCEIGSKVVRFAKEEGLDAHANSVSIRTEK